MLWFISGRSILAKDMIWVYFDIENKSVWILGFEKGENFERSVEVCCDSIVHENELSLWGWYFKSFVEYKLTIIHSFVKIAIIQNNIAWCIAIGHCDILTEDKF